jgi:hypothetical protein
VRLARRVAFALVQAAFRIRVGEWMVEGAVREGAETVEGSVSVRRHSLEVSAIYRLVMGGAIVAVIQLELRHAGGI